MRGRVRHPLRQAPERPRRPAQEGNARRRVDLARDAEIRLALLEADVNFPVVQDFVAHVRERALGEDVLKSLTPGQQVVKIVHDELT